MDEVQHDAIGRRPAEVEHSRSSAGQPDWESRAGPAQPGCLHRKGRSVQVDDFAGEEGSACVDRLTDGFQRLYLLDSQWVERQAPARSQAQECTAARKFVKGGNRCGRLCWMSGVGVGDARSDLQPLGGLGYRGHGHVEVPSREALVIDPAALETESLGLRGQRAHEAHRCLGDQVDAAAEPSL